MYIHTQDLTLHTERDIRDAQPNVSFPSPFVPPAEYAYVFPAPPPAYNANTHTATEGAPTLTQLGTWQQEWELVPIASETIAANLAAARAALLLKIDADTDAIYRAVQGDRAPEYLRAEKDALDYMTAGYTGPVPTSVSSWAVAKDQTNTWACDDILSTATAWRGAQEAIRSNRLLRKEQARNASDLAPVAAQWSGFVAAIRAALGVA